MQVVIANGFWGDSEEEKHTLHLIVGQVGSSEAQGKPGCSCTFED
jgi:hypothetical protein